MLLMWLGPLVIATFWLRNTLQNDGLRHFRPTSRGLAITGVVGLLIAMLVGRFGLFGPRFGWNGRSNEQPECREGWVLPSLCDCSDEDGSILCCRVSAEQDRFNVPACD